MRSTLVSSALGFLGALVPAMAAAGTVYVPLVAEATVDGVTYQSRLAVSNTGTEAHFFVVHFVGSFEDGTDRSAAIAPQLVGVPAGETYVFDGLGVDAGAVGMLEITGDDELQFQASLWTFRADGVETLAKQVPILGDADWVPAGERIVVDGLRRDASRLSGLALLNLEHAPSSCTVTLAGADGQLAIPPVPLDLPPLSQSFYADAFGVVGIGQAADMRFEVTCSGRAYALGVVVARSGEELVVLDRSRSLASSLVRPGEVPPAPACPATSICVDLPGVFHVATDAHRSFRREIPVEPGREFRRIDVEVTVTHGGWDRKFPDGIHNVFWLFSQKFAGATWAYLNARGPNRNLVSLAHNVGLGANQSSRTTASLALQPGSTYRVRYTYDTIADVVECVWSTIDGTELARMSDRPTVDRVAPLGGGFEVWFGIEGAHQIEVPSIGWAYRDARIELSM